jgi:hypothetical protein
MTDSLTLSIADIPVTLRLVDVDESRRAQIMERYAAFVVPAKSSFLVEICTGPGPTELPADTALIQQIHTAMCDGRLEFESCFTTGWADLAARRGALTLRPNGDPEYYLRVLYTWLCLEHDALLLHASSVIRQECGYVFFGPSGDGKTTIARLSLGNTVLSDDMSIVKKSGRMFRVYGIPFRGHFPEAPRTNTSADLKGLFMLVKAGKHGSRLVPKAQAVARLSACVPSVMRSPANAKKVVELCEQLVASVPVRALHFRQDPGFWEVIDGLG